MRREYEWKAESVRIEGADEHLNKLQSEGWDIFSTNIYVHPMNNYTFVGIVARMDKSAGERRG